MCKTLAVLNTAAHNGILGKGRWQRPRKKHPVLFSEFQLKRPTTIINTKLRLCYKQNEPTLDHSTFLRHVVIQRYLRRPHLTATTQNSLDHSTYTCTVPSLASMDCSLSIPLRIRTPLASTNRIQCSVGYSNSDYQAPQ